MKTIELLNSIGVNEWRTSSVIIETKEYDKFKTHKSNRIVRRNHINEIKDSIKDKLIFTVIFVNEKGEILDGQHRFMALKELGLPVNICILEGGGEEEIQIMNLRQSNWSHEDFLEYHIKGDNSHYITFNKLQKEYKINLSDLVRIIDTFNSNPIGEKELLSKFDDGFLHIDDYDAVKRFLDSLSMFRSYKVYNQTFFVRTYLKLYTTDIFDEEWMKKKVELRHEEFKRLSGGNLDTFGVFFEDIYNNRNKNKVAYMESNKDFGYVKTR